MDIRKPILKYTWKKKMQRIPEEEKLVGETCSPKCKITFKVIVTKQCSIGADK